MAIKSGAIIHDAQGFVIDRIQTGGVTNLNIPEERIREVGNWQTVATIRDIPDLSFDLESLDVSTEIEAILTGVDPTTTTTGEEFDFSDSFPIDIVSPFKAAGAYNVVKGIALPYLTLENVTYRFGLRANATETFTLRGDSIYYVPGTPKFQSFTLVNGTLTYALSQTALPYDEAGSTRHVLAACVKDPDTPGKYHRLFFGSDFTDTTTSITTAADWFDSGYKVLHVVFGTATAGAYEQTVHQGVSVKPAAVRGKDIDVYIGNTDATPTFTRWTGVQSVEATRRVNLEADEEFGNYHYITQDYDTADVTGNVAVKPVDPGDLFDKIAQVADVTTSEIAGPYTSVPLPMEIRINNPDTGDRIKTLYIPDARFTVPAVQARVGQKQTVTFNWASDSGTLLVYQGER